jgi:hypothetical protein
MKTTKALLFGAAVVAAITPIPHVQADNLSAAAAKASALVNRPIAGSPHALEEFPWLVRGSPPPTVARYPAQKSETYPNNLGAVAGEASAFVNRPVVASPHGLEEFPWLLRGSSPQAEANLHLKHNPIDTNNLFSPTGRASALVNRSIVSSTHRGDYP